MQLQDFKGAERLIEAVDAAVCCGNPHELVDRIKQNLCKLIRNDELILPESVCRPVEGHYARRLLYKSERYGYSMVVMTWGPDQGTTVHDHAGMWCVEAVCEGTIRVVQYEPVEQRGEDEFRFQQEESMSASVGTAGCLIPPHEYHTIHNASESERAVTLHIYGGEMECCNVFQPIGDGWYRRQRKSLAYDAA